MSKAYVILAHKYPHHLNRLIRSLNDGMSVFFIHIDQSSDITMFDNLDVQRERIRFVRRERTTWASYGLVRATLHGLQAVKDTGYTFRHVILLSGQDYPIRSNEFINHFSEQHADKIFMEFHRLPDAAKWQPNGGLYRVNKYFAGLKTWQRLFSKSLNLLSRFVPFLKRRPYRGMDPYAGSMWWMLNMPAINYILTFIKEHPGYIDFHRFTFAPDEVFFHMILLNAKDSGLTENIINNDKRFIKWKDMAASHPEIIAAENLPEIMESDALFARKFNVQDEDILNKIDEYRISAK